MDKPRKWWVSAFLSLLEPGLGQIYNGQAVKGLILLFLSFMFLPLSILGLKSDNILVLIIVYGVFAVAYFLFVLVDAVRTARKQRYGYQLKKYNRVWIYLSIILVVWVTNAGLAEYIKNNYIQAYSIPSSSNEPTLLAGDHVLADQHPSARTPDRGDIVVFQFSKNPQKDFVMRVIAVAGDTVEIRNKSLFLNGKRIDEEYAIHKDTTTLSADQAPRDFFGPVTVPVESYFVLGDNRDRSYDSRYGGFIPKDNINGTVKTVYWSWDSGRSAVRWGRIGLTL